MIGKVINHEPVRGIMARNIMRDAEDVKKCREQNKKHTSTTNYSVSLNF